MIRSFADKEAAGIWDGRASRRLPSENPGCRPAKTANVAQRGDGDAYDVVIVDYH